MEELKLKLTIDGKEGIAVIGNYEELLTKVASKMNFPKVQPPVTNSDSSMLQQFANQLVNVEGSEKEVVAGIVEFINYNKLSEDQIRSVISMLREQQSNTQYMTKEYQAYSTAINNVTTAVGVLSGKFNEVQPPINKTDILLQEFQKDLLLIDVSSEEAVAGIADFIKYNQLSENQIRSVISTLQVEQGNLAVGSDKWIQHGKAIENVAKAQQLAISSQRQMVPTSNAARMAVQQFGYALGDSSMIMVDFRMFLLGIGNNIPFLVQGLSEVSKEAKAANMSMGQYLKQNIDGSMKLVLGANAVMLALMVLPKVYSMIANAAGDADEKIRKINETMGEEEKKLRMQQAEFNDLIDVIKDTTQTEEVRKEALEGLRQKYPEYLTFLKDEKTNLSEIADAQKKANEEFQLKIQLAAAEKVLKGFYEEAVKAQVEINNLKSEREKILAPFSEEEKKSGVEYLVTGIDYKIQDLENGKQKYLNKIKELNDSVFSTQIAIDKTNEGTIGARKKKLEDQLKAYESQWEKLDEKDVKGRASLLLKIQKVKDDIKKLDIKELTNDHKTKDDTSGLITQVKEADELKAKLEELKTQQNDSLSLHQKEIKILETKRDAAVKAIQDEITQLEKKKKLDDSDKKRIENLKYDLSNNITSGGYTQQIAEKEKSYQQSSLKAQFDYEEKKMQLENKSEVDIIRHKKDFYNRLLNIETDPDRITEISRNLDLLDQEEINAIENLENEKQKIINSSIVNQFDQKRAEANLEYELEKKKYGDSEALRDKHRLKMGEIDKEEFLYKVEMTSQIANTIADAYNQVYSAIESNVKDEIDQWKDKEAKKLDEERKAALAHTRTSKQKEKINEEYDKKEEALEDQAKARAREKLAAWFAWQKAASIAQATINTFEGATKAIAQGGILGAVLAGAVIAAGLANVAVIASQKMPGYDKGGKLIPGRPGIFEGNQVEVVAPEKNFLDVMRNEYNPQLLKSAAITMGLMAAKQQINSGLMSRGYSSSGDSELLKEMKILNKNFQYYAENPVPPVMTKSAMKQVGRTYSAANRRSKL